MDFDQFINRLNWKKVIVIILGCFFAGWILREIFFFEFVRAFKNTYSQFVTQFDQDQNRIHNIIEDNFKKQQAMQKEMDERTKNFHDYVDKSMNQTLNYLNNGKQFSEQVQQKNNQRAAIDHKEEESYWQRIQKAFFSKNGVALPSYQELEKNASMNEINNARDKELDLIEKKHDEIRSAWRKERDELNKKYWEMARERYFKTTGKMLPSYEEIDQSLIATKQGVNHD